MFFFFSITIDNTFWQIIHPCTEYWKNVLRSHVCTNVWWNKSLKTFFSSKIICRKALKVISFDQFKVVTDDVSKTTDVSENIWMTFQKLLMLAKIYVLVQSFMSVALCLLSVSSERDGIGPIPNSPMNW